jgi:CheY-like chemotaxis protein
MDDEEFIRDSVSIMLRRFGYEVECAKNGNEALALFERERFAGGNYELIILDLTIPGGIGGREVVAKIRESDTSIPVIVASGYSDASVLAQPEAFGFSGSIAKPFTEKEFGRLLKSIFEKRD